jgi:hypothetical protein
MDEPEIEGGVSGAMALCDNCARLKKLTAEGKVPLHYLAMPVSNRAIHSVQERAARVRRRCPGSGQPPRRGER